jgi:hypothetical protein
MVSFDPHRRQTRAEHVDHRQRHQIGAGADREEHFIAVRGIEDITGKQRHAHAAKGAHRAADAHDRADRAARNVGRQGIEIGGKRPGAPPWPSR